MKKELFCLAITIFGIVNLNAQEYKIAVNAGVPISASNEYSAAFDVSYLLNITDKFDIGLTTGFSHWFKRPEFYLDGLNISETKEISLVPIALTNRFNIVKRVNLSLDLGYAIPVKSQIYQSGLYFAPKIQYGISNSLDVVLGYRVAKLNSDYFDSTIDMLTLGIEFKL